MPPIYKPDTKPLKEFIDDIKSINSTIVIPDLQRPYVWKPLQVIKLVDSIFKKWPFGSLLCWDVKGAKNPSRFIPYRAFWAEYVSRDLWDKKSPQPTSIDRSSDRYTMILDGQQRLQSLLLALGGESWGFTMKDKDWKKDIFGKDESIDDKYWSTGNLCLDVESFLDEYKKCRHITGIDIEKCLKWAVTDINTGLSNKEKEDVIPVTSLNDGKFLRFSKIWDIAKAGGLPSDYERIITDSFSEIPSEKLQGFLKQMSEFMTIVSEVKEHTEITCLIIKDFENSGISEPGDYNNAIVNIFARLNTAGRVLTNEEITLAWLKTGWREAKDEVEPNEDTCASALEDLLSDINNNNDENGMQMSMDGLVRILSLLWIILEQDGEDKNRLTLDDRDLINGDIMKNIGKSTLIYWDDIKEAILACKETFEARKLNECFLRSFNAFNIICGWRFISVISGKRNIGIVKKTECQFDTRINDVFDMFIDKWYFSTMLSGTWSDATKYPEYIEDLCKLHKKIEKCSDPDKAISLLGDVLVKWLEGLRTATTNHINSMRAYSRNGVGAYRNILWLWNRLRADRWGEIQKPLKRGRTAPKLEVDHAIPVRIWDDKVEAFFPKDKSCDSAGQEITFSLNGSLYTRSSLLSEINLLGNCSLLLRSHNRSKQGEQFGFFLDVVYDGDQGKIDALKSALKMDDEFLYPDDATIEQILGKIQERTNEIRKELVSYFNQKESKRQDVG